MSYSAPFQITGKQFIGDFMSNLIKSDEIMWDDFEIVGITTNTPDFGSGDGQVMVHGVYASGLTGLNHLPAYLEDGGDDPEGMPMEIIRWYWGEEMVAESLDLAIYLRGEDFDGFPVIHDCGWLWEALQEVAESEEI